MKVLMLGWEFPPWISGGLGTACHGLTHALTRRGVEVLFVLPRSMPPTPVNHLRMMGVDLAQRPSQGHAPPQSIAAVEQSLPQMAGVKFKAVASVIVNPYSRALRSAPSGQGVVEAVQAPGDRVAAEPADAHLYYDGDVLAHVRRYAERCEEAVQDESFDVIHAHDWMTWPAGSRIARRTGKPLVVHLHSTEYDRSGAYACEPICRVERQGVHTADRVVCVSKYTQRACEQQYGVPEGKTTVVYNGINLSEPPPTGSRLPRHGKLVLFLGRVTSQKGPEYFMAAAKLVLEKMPGVTFVLAGGGDQQDRMMHMADQSGLGASVVFTGFLSGPEVDRAYELADVYVMPSVSEPFGISALEAIRRDVPVIISRHSGVCEVLDHVLKVDFWDVRDIADKILAVLRRPPLRETLRNGAAREIRSLPWDSAAEKCVDVYQTLTKIG